MGIPTKFPVVDGALAAGDTAIAEGNIIVGNSSGLGVALDASGDTKLLVGNGTTITSVAMSSDVTMANTGAVTIGATKVLSSMLGANLAKGYIPLNIFSMREAISDDFNVAADAAARGSGGILCSDTTPTLTRVNGAADKAARLSWATTLVDEIQFAPVAKPPDFNAGADFTIHLMTAKDANNDTVTIDVQCFDGVGDTEMGGATGTITQALAESSVTIANANVAAAPGILTVVLVPSAHAGDVLYLYGAWIEYARAT